MGKDNHGDCQLMPDHSLANFQGGKCHEKRTLSLLNPNSSGPNSTAPTVVAAPPQQGGSKYTVQADDTLSKIAEKEYGDPLAYTAILFYSNQQATAQEAPPLREVSPNHYAACHFSEKLDLAGVAI